MLSGLGKQKNNITGARILYISIFMKICERETNFSF